MTKNYGKTLSDRQKKALPYFASCRSYEEGCRKAEISKNAFYEWLKEPLFKSKLDQMRDSIVEEAVDTLKANVTKAACALVELLEESDNPALKRSIANDIIGHVFKVKEMQEFEKRLMALELSLETRKAV